MKVKYYIVSLQAFNDVVQQKLHLIFAIILLVIVNICQAQQLKSYKTVDRHCKDCSEMIWGRNGFELKDISESKEDVEIRFLMNGKHVSRSITVIKGSKGKFTAAYYFQYVDDFSFMRPDSAKELNFWEPHPFKRF